MVTTFVATLLHLYVCTRLMHSYRNENATKSYQTSTNRTARGKKPAEQSDAVDGVTSDTNVDTSSEVSGLPHPQTS